MMIITLRLDLIGVGGAVFEGSIQTPLVRAESGNDLRYVTSTSLSGPKHPNKVNQLASVNELTSSLFYPPPKNRLESATRTLQMQAPQGVALESQAGDISATSYEDLRLWSTGGSV